MSQSRAEEPRRPTESPALVDDSSPPGVIAMSDSGEPTPVWRRAGQTSAAVLTTSVVICCYTALRWDRIVLAVESVRAQTTPAGEVIVVIDHNDDLLAQARAELSSVRVIPSEGPRGLSGARNTGCEVASGEVVIFLDDDATAEPDWIGQLLAAYDDDNVLGVGGAAVPDWESPPPSWWPQEFLWVVGCTYIGQPTTRTAVRNLMGCNMSVRRDVLEEVGGFDSSLGRTADRPLGCEETELCIRARQLFPGGSFIFEPAALVHHWVPASRATRRYFWARCQAEGTSKAWVANRVGSGAALAAETVYTRQVLPRGLERNLGELLHGDLGGLGRAAAILGGFAATAASFGAAKIRHAVVRPSAPKI